MTVLLLGKQAVPACRNELRDDTWPSAKPVLFLDEVSKLVHRVGPFPHSFLGKVPPTCFGLFRWPGRSDLGPGSMQFRSRSTCIA